MFARLFVEAYPASFISELKLDNILVINNYELSLIVLLSRVQKLDLSGSQLDDSHDIWSMTVELASLRVLILANVGITDRGLKKILLPSFDGRKLSHLAHLDMSGTGFTIKTLASLKRMPQLKEVLFFSEEPNLTLESIREVLTPWFRISGRPSIEQVTTTGFGSGLLDRWGEILAETRKLRQEAAELRPAFYGLKQVPGAKDARPKPTRQANKVMFHRTAKRAMEPSETSHGSKKRLRPDSEDIPKSEEPCCDILSLYR